MREWRRCTSNAQHTRSVFINMFASYKRATRTKLPEGCNMKRKQNAKGEMLKRRKKIVSHAKDLRECNNARATR